MPIYDFRCSNGHVHEAMMPWREAAKGTICPECEKPAERVILRAPVLNYAAMGAQKHVSPEFQARFDKMHRDQKAKEEKCLKEHGDYGASYGYMKPKN